MKEQPIKVIVKTESDGDVILFLPNTTANQGTIAYYSPTGGHGEACYEYYLACKPIRDNAEANKWVSFYANYGEYAETIRAYKQSFKDCRENAERIKSLHYV